MALRNRAEWWSLEDHVDSAIMLSTFLSMAGHRVRVAYKAA
jgi:hypothetical protein